MQAYLRVRRVQFGTRCTVGVCVDRCAWFSTDKQRKLIATQSSSATNGFSSDIVQQLHWDGEKSRFELIVQPPPSLSLEDRLKSGVAVFMPHGYPDSVAPTYLSYVQWQLAAAVASSAGMVLSRATSWT